MDVRLLQITNYRELIKQIALVLRPNGMACFMEWDFGVYDSSRRKINGDASDSVDSHVAKFIKAMHDASRARGGNVDAAHNLERWCLETRGFQRGSIRKFDWWVPCMPWCKEQGKHGDKMRRWGAAQLENCLVRGFPETAPLCD
jgi:hypothetical protein